MYLIDFISAVVYVVCSTLKLLAEIVGYWFIFVFVSQLLGYDLNGIVVIVGLCSSFVLAFVLRCGIYWSN